jgi:Arc/MetJ family transcription regulator
VYDHTHGRSRLRTNIVLDDELLKEAFRLSAARTKKDLVHEALRELIHLRGRKSLKDLKGKIRFQEGYDHKALRQGR